MKKTNVKEYFPHNYAESRERFLKLSQDLPSPKIIGKWKVDSKTDSDLFVDHVWLPPTKTPETLLVFISGIHGSETYAGSAILNLFMSEMISQIDRSRTGIFITHAMNPYGFKHHRRCTQNHVNLNRNFSVSGQLFKTKNPEAAKLNSSVLSRKPVTSTDSQLIKKRRDCNGKIFFDEISMEELTKGISPGQFERHDDLEFGGKTHEPQTKAMIERMTQLIPDYKDIIAFDLHTGLGERGRLHLLTDGHPKSLHPELFGKIFKPKEDEAFYTFTPPQTEGFYHVQGATNSMFADIAKNHQRVCAVTLEFGTLGHSLDNQMDAFNRWIVEHEGTHYGYANAAIEREVKALNFERSYPDDDLWRMDVLEAAYGLIQNVAERIKV